MAICDTVPYMGQAMFMKCSAQVHSLNLLYGTCPLLHKMPPLSLDSLHKEAYFPRPAGGAVEKNWQLVSPATKSVDLRLSAKLGLNPHFCLSFQQGNMFKKKNSMLNERSLAYKGNC